ncbi:peroxidase [Coprinopsis marcescibilis]|uniref:Peroxidase n=1 Tax=Coprinopsis marcescibilis TaxID=230819 RepID=A0A5C3KE13_COPMA|nr:peroxidase [Coprinopsis marcescibilis]
MKLSVFAVTLAVIVGSFAAPQDTVDTTDTAGRPGGGTCPGRRNTANRQCCVWFNVLDDLQANFYGGGKCESPVRKILRIVFHDAIGFSPALTAAGQFGGGGADGSIIEHSAIELAFPANGGLTTTIEALRTIGTTHNVSFADLIQFATAVGEANCPGAPRLEFLAGRPRTSQPSPPGLIPGPGNTVTAILNRMGDAGLTADDVVDLMASHSIASQEGLNAAVFRSPLDTTPAVFDSQFYIESSLKGTLFPGGTPGFAEVQSPIPGEFRMQSDFALARDPRTACRWQSNASNNDLMARRHRAAMAKMSLLGINRRSLIDCSDIVPVPRRQPTRPHIPGGLTNADLDNSCPGTPFPNLPTTTGPLPTLAAAP